MKTSMKTIRAIAGVVMASVLVWSLGCEQIIGLDGPYLPAPDEVKDAGVCMEGTSEECYSGDPSVKGIGACKPGTRTCSNGAWGACMGEGAPSMERCSGNDDDCDGNATCTGSVGWALSFGGPGNDSSTGVTIDAMSNVIVAGSYSSTASFGGSTHTTIGGNDIIVFKLDSTGKHLWSKAFGSTASDGARGVAVDPQGNVIVVGALAGAVDFGGGPVPQAGTSMFVVKLDPSGNHVWSKSFTGAMGLGGMDIAADAMGNVLISTTLTGTMDFGGGLQTAQNDSLAVVKLDPTGKHVWSKLFGSSKAGSLRSTIAVDATGNIGVTGSFHGQIAFGMTMLTSSKRELFVAKLAPTGESLWAVKGAAATDCDVDGLAFDSTGAVIVAGTFPSPALAFDTNTITGFSDSDAFVAKFTSDGSYVWGRGIGMGGLVEVGAEVEVDAANNIAFTGNTTSATLDFGSGPIGPAGIFAAKLDPTGKTIWAKSSDVAAMAFPTPTVAVDKQGHVVLSRGFTPPLTFGGVNLAAYGLGDIFVIQLGP